MKLDRWTPFLRNPKKDAAFWRMHHDTHMHWTEIWWGVVDEHTLILPQMGNPSPKRMRAEPFQVPQEGKEPKEDKLNPRPTRRLETKYMRESR